MGAEVAIEPRREVQDDITLFLGWLPDDLYNLRARLRTARNCASYRVTTAKSADARALLWMCSEAASAWLYVDAAPEMLRSQSDYCRRLLALAEQAEKIWVELGE
jgi:hypothetical protein